MKNTFLLVLIFFGGMFFYPRSSDPLNFPLPSFLLQQIEEDLQSYNIDMGKIDLLWRKLKSRFGFIRYKYLNGKLYSSTNRETRAYPRYVVVTNALESIKNLPEIDFILSLGDGLENWDEDIPVFTFAKNKNCKGGILIPDCEALNPVDRSYITKLVNEKDQTWTEKREKLHWRGFLSGPAIVDGDVKTSARAHLAFLSLVYPDVIDAAIVNCNEKIQKQLPKCRFGIPINPIEHFPYKYLIDVDGFSCCYSRTYWILLSNSLMLKQITENVQWFYNGLKPYIHYIPVNYDLSNLLEQIEYCKEHDFLVAEIAQNATKFAEENLQYEHNLNYLYWALKKYSNHMSYVPKITAEDQKASVSFFRKSYFQVKGLLRKALKKQPIASQTILDKVGSRK